MAEKLRTKETDRLDLLRLPETKDGVRVVEVTPTEPVKVDEAFTLPPLPEEQRPDGSVILPAGVLRHIRVDREALDENNYIIEDNKDRAGRGEPPRDLLPTWRVRDTTKKVKRHERYYAIEVRGSTMCLTGQEEQSRYSCGGSYNETNQTLYLATLAEVVAYTKPPRA